MAAYDSVWCGARNGASRSERPVAPRRRPRRRSWRTAHPHPASGGSRPGIVRASMRLAGSRRPDQQQPVAAGEGDLQCAPCLQLAADLSEVRRRETGLVASTGAGSAAPVRRIRDADRPWAGRSRCVARAAAGPAPPRRAAMAAPTTSMPSTSAASSSPSAGTTTRRSPRRASAATIGRIPGTDRISPPSDSSPTSAARPGAARTCSDPSRIPSAIARSSDAPALRCSAGARLTVIRRGGCTNPAFRIAPRTRSRASWSAASASPTIVNPGRPPATSTSTRITRPSRPTTVADSSVASTPRPYRRPLDGGSPSAYRTLSR